MPVEIKNHSYLTYLFVIRPYFLQHLSQFLHKILFAGRVQHVVARLHNSII